MPWYIDSGVQLLTDGVFALALLALTVFTLLQRNRSPRLGSLVLVAAGLGVWGLYGAFDALTDALDGFFYSYGVGTFAIPMLLRLVRALAHTLALVLIVLGAVRVAAALGAPVEPD